MPCDFIPCVAWQALWWYPCSSFYGTCGNGVQQRKFSCLSSKNESTQRSLCEGSGFCRMLNFLWFVFRYCCCCVSVLCYLYWFPVKDSVGKIEDIFTLEERERSCSIACDSDKRNTQWSDWGPCRRDCSKKESSGSQVRSRTSFLYKRNMTDSEFEERYILKERKDLSKRLLLLEIRS